MKKYLILGLVLILCLTGCGNNTTEKDEEQVLSESVDKNTDGDEEIVEEKPEPKEEIKVYSEEELCEMAKVYYYMRNGVEPPIVEVDSVEGNIVSIHLYEDMGDHTATWDWYSIDKTTGKGSGFNDLVDLTEVDGLTIADVYIEDNDSAFEDDIPYVDVTSNYLGQKLNPYDNSLGYPLYGTYHERLLNWNKINNYKYYDASNQTEFLAVDSAGVVVGYGYIYDYMYSDYQMVGGFLGTDINWPTPKIISIDKSKRYYIWQAINGYFIVEGLSYSSACETDYKKSYIMSYQHVSDKALSKLLDGSDYVAKQIEFAEERQAEADARKGKIHEDNLINEAEQYFYHNKESAYSFCITDDDMIDIYSWIHVTIDSIEGDIVKINLQLENEKWDSPMYIDTLTVDRATGKGKDSSGREFDWSYLIVN